MSWNKILAQESQKPYFLQLQEFLREERRNHLVYPNESQVFRALELTPLEKTKVVIIGQDPYPTPGNAHGLAFSVEPNVRPIPKSLQNIFKEIHENFGTALPENGNLESWAKQGVLLLNSVLTVRSGEPKSHANKGWEIFTDTLISTLNKEKHGIVFILWGNDAKKKQILLNNPNNLVLSGVHPSPLSAHRGFFGCQHFKLANLWLEKNGILPIKW
jgi:uracil-DNA glycosylase